MSSDEAIRASVNCNACGYDLRGLPKSGRCPECGLFVWFTLEQAYSERLLQGEDQELERWKSQSDAVDEQQSRTNEQLDRYDQVLMRWEAVATRMEALLSKLEQRFGD